MAFIYVISTNLASLDFRKALKSFFYIFFYMRCNTGTP